MTKKLISLNTHTPFVFAFRVLWSSSWATLQPWENDGKPVGYISFKKEAHGNMMLRIVSLGPLALIAGTMM